ncbi:DUF4436 domain-containing protein [Lichenihabitans sp. PAMC28606]|uniref:DUF4436 family protein n=1 Tax=Lichenihabitans sp. PAMC28606 TaxID=2880932 RepID=UPI001D0A6F47|nr:DUF4436 family protein [Lichenihabitans sp. PAMC28606]UDL93438.1 DUF4436 domain-containing protein [Lichenihabitans sp. PAMC28606]
MKRPSFHAMMLVALMGLFSLGYAVFLGTLGSEANLAIESYGPSKKADGVRPQLQVYAEIVSIDAVNGSMRMRFSFTPAKVLQGRRLKTPLRDMTVRIADDSADYEYPLAADQPVASQLIDVDLNNGSVFDYPLDAFTARLSVDAFEDPPAGQEGVAPNHLAVEVALWDGFAGWTIRTAERAADGTSAVTIAIDLRRSGAVRFFVLSLYAVMAIIAIAALTMASLVFLHVRKMEISIASTLAAMLFALPVMRYGLQGSPPLGVRADVLIYLWAEIGVALGLCLVVATWARGEPKPP